MQRLLGRTGAVRRLHSGIAEVDSVNSALFDAAARLGERDRSLRESEQRLQIALDAASLGTWELRQSEALARSQADEIQVIYDAAPIGMVLFDRDFRFLRINERLAAINGRSNADHAGRLIEDMLPAETTAALRGIQSRLLAGEEFIDVELTGPDRVTGKDGTFLVSYRPLRDHRGDVCQFLGTVLDITGRREAEAALSAAPARRWPRSDCSTR